MMFQIKRWLASPVFPDDETQTRRASLLNATLLTLLGFAVALIIANFFGGRTPLTLVGLNGIVVVTSLGLLYLMRRGMVQLASTFTMFLGFVIITLAAMALGTIRTPTTALYLALIAIAGLLFDLPGILAITVASSLAVAGLMGAENAHWLPPPDYTVTLTQWITYTSLFGFVSGLSYWSFHAMRRGLALADKEIAERKRVEEALRESEERYRELVENANDIVYTLDLAGNFTSANRAAERITGYTHQEVLTLNLAQVVSPDNFALARQMLQSKVTNGQPTTYPVEIYTKDGHAVSLELSTRLIYQAGKLVGSQGIARDITERKRAEQARRDSEANLHAVFNATDESVFLLAADETVLALNDVGVQRMGRPREALIGRKVYALMPPEVAARRRPFIDHALLTGEPVKFEDERDGHWMVNRLHPILNADGRVARLAIYSRDITERKRAEELLRVSESRAQAMLRAIPDLMFRMDRQGIFLDYRADISDLYSQSEQTIIGKRNRDITPPEFADLIDRQIHTTLKTGALQTFEYRLLIPGRGLRDYEARMAPSGADEVTAIVRDITERKRVEEKLKASEQYIRSIIDCSVDMIITTDNTRRIVEFNGAAEATFGYTREEVLGRYIDQLYQKPEEGEAIRHSLLKEGKFIGEASNRRKNGETFVSSLTSSILRGADGDVLGVVGVSRDITERKRLESELQYERDFLSLVINNMGQGLTVTDSDSRFILVNQAYAKLFGFKPEDMIGKRPADVTAETDQAGLAKAHAARQRGETTIYESGLLRADGTVAPVLITGTPRWKDGTVAGTIAVITDLTEIKRAEEQLHEANLQLEDQLGKLQNLQIQLREHAIRDPLTQLYNRRYLDETLPREIARALRLNQHLGILMIDLDHFKNINDTYGHAAGDEALQTVAQIIMSQLRTSDIVCRYGGEEILCVLPDTTQGGVLYRAEQLCALIAQTAVSPANPAARVTVSIGVAMFPAHGADMTAILKAADAALYRAKQAGRNCVRVASIEKTE